MRPSATLRTGFVPRRILPMGPLDNQKQSHQSARAMRRGAMPTAHPNRGGIEICPKPGTLTKAGHWKRCAMRTLL